MEEKLNAHIDNLTSKDATIDNLTSEFLKLKQQIELLSTELKVVKDSTELIRISKDKTEIKNKLYVDQSYKDKYNIESKKLELVSVPIGTIVAFYGNGIPEGWAFCDGKNGTPDLTNKFIRGGADLGKNSNTYGIDEIILSAENLPEHNHVYYESWFTATKKNIFGFMGEKSDVYTGHTYNFQQRLTKSISDDKKLSSTELKNKAFSIVPKHLRIGYIMKIK